MYFKVNCPINDVSHNERQRPRVYDVSESLIILICETLK